MKFHYLLAILLLAGCAGPLPVIPDDPQQAWQLHQHQLSQVQDWRMNGRLSVIRGVEAWYFSVKWRQQEDDYEIFIAGPFGAGQVKLTGDSDRVMLRDADKQVYTSRNPEILLYEHTGVFMPVSGLRYWVLGLPDPDKNHNSDLQLDDYGRLSELQQQDWQVVFDDYVSVEQLQLPEQLVIQRDNVKVKLVVDDWQVRPI